MTASFTTLRAAHANGGVCELYCNERHARLQERFREFFARAWRPEREPSVLTFENVILADRGDASCLYDGDGRRIDASALARRTRDLEPVFFRAPPTLDDIEVTDTIEEPVVLQSLFFAHWGHFLLESTTRMWASEALACASIWASCDPLGETAPPYADFLSAAGVRRRSRRQPGETRLAKCLVPTAAFEVYALAHPSHLAAPHRVARQLLRGDRRDPRPVYFSRSRFTDDGAARRCIENEADFEARLAARGVRIAHLQDLTLAEQIGIVNAHSILIGPWGSAMHNILFSLRGPEITTFVLIFGALPRDFLLVDSIVGNNAHYLDLMRPVEGSSDDHRLRLDVDRAMDYLQGCGVV